MEIACTGCKNIALLWLKVRNTTFYTCVCSAEKERLKNTVIHCQICNNLFFFTKLPENKLQQINIEIEILSKHIYFPQALTEGWKHSINMLRCSPKSQGTFLHISFILKAIQQKIMTINDK